MYPIEYDWPFFLLQLAEDRFGQRSFGEWGRHEGELVYLPGRV